MEYKRKKYYYPNKESNLKKCKLFNLETGMTGFLCTCNFREKDCVRDAYKLLNEFADEIDELNKDKIKICTEGSSIINEIQSPENDEQNNSDEEDISTALSKEINQLKAESDKPIALRRFQVVNTGVKNVVFIKTTLSNPLELVSHIIKELDSTKKQRSRFLLRLLPIEAVCKAYMNDIKSVASVIFEKYFSQEPKTFSIVFNRHSNDSIHREEIINDLAEIIKKKNPGNRANLKNPELAVVVEVIRGLCLISIAPDYYKYRKYNLLEICARKQNDTHVKDSNTKNSDTDKKETEISNKSTTNVEDTITQDNEDDNVTKSETSNITEEVQDEK
ncbi:THUMP domain-containing protein 1 homolog [Polistes fuscatus]|uniref:THUMP domain-containing protein 1 homolog n=1 Tax=Polistes fuscatus TaxID=30207 RepID=UPI001CA8AB87|nr:THUMP domain-containing protein 1 homolog [Polistes fuscatus]